MWLLDKRNYNFDLELETVSENKIFCFHKLQNNKKKIDKKYPLFIARVNCHTKKTLRISVTGLPDRGLQDCGDRYTTDTMVSG